MACLLGVNSYDRPQHLAIHTLGKVLRWVRACAAMQRAAAGWLEVHEDDASAHTRLWPESAVDALLESLGQVGLP